MYALDKMYTQLDVHVPVKFHERIKEAVKQDRSLGVKIHLHDEPNASIWVTPGQLLKIQKGVIAGKKSLTIRMSRRQVKDNLKREGGFLSALLSLATKALPTILTGLAGGVLSGVVEKAVKGGDGLFLGKRGYGTAQVNFEGNGITLTPVEAENLNGIYLKHDGQIFRGKGILLGPDSPFKDTYIVKIVC